MLKRLQKGWKWLVIAGLLIALLALIRARRARNHKDGRVNRQVIRNSKYKALEPYIIAQSKHESDSYTSEVYKRNNNPFGFKVASKRDQVGKVGTRSPEGNNYWKFPNDTEAFKDLLKYFDQVSFPTSVSSVTHYATELKKRGYFTDTLSNYVNGMKRFL